MSRRSCWLATAAVLGFAASAVTAGLAQTAHPLPPLAGAEAPRVVPALGDDGIYHQAWFMPSFLDLADDAREAEASGKRFAVIFEQRGCVYCKRMHTEVLAQKWVNDYVRENFTIVQLDLWGSRKVTDFDGTQMPEKQLAERWGVMFTPTIVFFKDGLQQLMAVHAGGGTAAIWGQPLEVTRMQLGFGVPTFIDMFSWIRTKTYEKDRNFQRFHVARMAERDAQKK